MPITDPTSFSARQGFADVRTTIQRDDADCPLRADLWNLITFRYWNDRDPDHQYHITGLLSVVWCNHFGNFLDEWPGDRRVIAEVRGRFLDGPFNEMYDLLQFIPQNFNRELDWGVELNDGFIDSCNRILENHSSAYRFVDGLIVEVTSKTEVAAIEQALNDTGSRYAAVHEHLQRSLQLLADREACDYRNSIKEAISAVESIACIISQKPKATLKEALDLMEQEHSLHGALKSSFINLYGYTSDADGIRHKLMEASNLKHFDALYMLITCSAFVSYLISKSDQQSV